MRSTSEHHIDINQQDIFEERLCMSQNRHNDYYRPDEPENHGAEVCQKLQFSVKKCAEVGILRAVVNGKLQGSHKSQDLYHWYRMPKQEVGAHRQVHGECWIAKFMMRVENNGIDLMVSAKA
jgi:hypothetical protein